MAPQDILKSRLIISVQAVFTSTDMMITFYQNSLFAKEHEMFGVVFLDNQHRTGSSTKLSTGTINAVSIYG
ncbi:hypothetical protein BCT11_16405 [Vibrio sp. 10N.222.52.B12]|nr:hypothetical protein BCT11_16405 [Vibrio sp. 10N.222.52.B12]